MKDAAYVGRINSARDLAVYRAWAKRRDEAHFVSKLTNSDGENSETDSSLDFASSCEYISADEHLTLTK
jgi:hypothetical protein